MYKRTSKKLKLISQQKPWEPEGSAWDTQKAGKEILKRLEKKTIVDQQLSIQQHYTSEMREKNKFIVKQKWTEIVTSRYMLQEILKRVFEAEVKIYLTETQIHMKI